ncbi:MAG TPA: radical SAM family heme chaperone HemW [Halanaerobiales bacterium]|nr:radical SAM family heme chaperone HemW [Halanaerobiales bacterium]HPZ62923.1 radical SAM family heme chaperone HemW [Halanaerobiales bacterium]HQD04172.1 radical SAM family heme chaperone HemW [Halanaerobiales bacterium]
MNRDMNNDINNDTFGLYLHIPFCQGKCRYCDFYSVNFEQALLEKYLSYLKKELLSYSILLQGKGRKVELETIYFGGGTPGLLSAEELAQVLDLISQEFSLSPLAEVSLEVNPSSLTGEKLQAYRKSGINRLSIGVQSFNDRELSFLGRRHDAREAREKIELAGRYFDNYSIDLIYAIPDQELADWERTLQQAIQLSPYHVSLYSLQIEEGTPLASSLAAGEFEETDNSLDAEMYLLARQFLRASGYEHYEISNFARNGYQSRHNRLYWEFRPYLGVGPGSHSFMGGERFWNHADLSLYMEKLNQGELPVQERIQLSREEQMAEMVFMGLRLLEGVSLTEFYKMFNVSLTEYYAREIEKLQSQGLITIGNDRISLTEKGLLLGNLVFMEFLP